MWLHLSLLTWKPFFTTEYKIGMKRDSTAGDMSFRLSRSLTRFLRRYGRGVNHNPECEIFISKYDKHIHMDTEINNKFIGFVRNMLMSRTSIGADVLEFGADFWWLDAIIS